MEIRILKVSLGIQIVVALIIACIGAVFSGAIILLIFGTTHGLRPDDGVAYLIFGGITVFTLIFAPFASLAYFSIKELNNVSITKNITINFVNAIICSLFLFPFTLLHFFLIYKIHKGFNDTNKI